MRARTIGLTRSVPGVPTALAITMTTSAVRRIEPSLAEVMTPTFAKKTRRIGYSAARPKISTSEPTNPKYRSAAMRGTRSEVPNERRKPTANGKINHATAAPSAKSRSASGSHGPAARRSAGVSAGRTNAHACQSQIGIARTTPPIRLSCIRMPKASPTPLK